MVLKINNNTPIVKLKPSLLLVISLLAIFLLPIRVYAQDPISPTESFVGWLFNPIINLWEYWLGGNVIDTSSIQKIGTAETINLPVDLGIGKGGQIPDYRSPNFDNPNSLPQVIYTINGNTISAILYKNIDGSFEGNVIYDLYTNLSENKWKYGAIDNDEDEGTINRYQYILSSDTLTTYEKEGWYYFYDEVNNIYIHTDFRDICNRNFQPYNYTKEITRRINKTRITENITSIRYNQTSNCSIQILSNSFIIEFNSDKYIDPFFAGGDGTSINPFQITNWTGLNATRNNLTAYYILNNNLNSSLADYNGIGNNFKPIGVPFNEFRGNFNGNGYNISDIRIIGTDNYGLFGGVSGAFISNLGLKNATVHGNDHVGGFDGGLGQVTIDKCFFEGNIIGGDYVGGLIGDNQIARINNSYFNGTISGNNYVGGLIGAYSSAPAASFVIANSYSKGTVTSNGKGGGLIGACPGDCGFFINDSYSNAIVSSSGGSGGLIGSSSYSVSGTIDNSYATGNVGCGGYNCGGLVGNMYGRIDNSYATGNIVGGGDYFGGLVGNGQVGLFINSSYATGSVAGLNVRGAIISSYYYTTIDNSYWYNRGDGIDCYSGGNTGCTAKTNINYFYNVSNQPMNIWDFVNIWDNVFNLINFPPLRLQGLGIIPFPSVIFNYQIPNDITATNIFAIGANVSYNISGSTPSDIINLSTIQIFYKSNSTTRDIITFVNGSADSSGFDNYTSNSSISFLFNLGDNEIYPGTFNLDDDVTDDTPHNINTLTSNNEYVSIEFLNITNTTIFNFLEIMSNSTSIQNFYYCNNSYNFASDPTTNINCNFFNTIPANQPYNHTHSIYSSHQIVPLVINNTSGQVAGVSVTSISYFLLRGNNGVPNIINYYSVPITTRTNAIRTTIDNGATWTSQAYTVDSHFHQFSGNSSVYYYVCANDTLNKQNCSSTRTDLFQIGGLPPTTPLVYSPSSPQYTIKDSIFIAYTQSFSPNSYPIFYNISLLNTDNSFNRTIITNNSNNLTYLWSNTLFGNFIVRVTACDTLNQCSSGFSQNFSIIQARPTLTLVANPSFNVFTNTFVKITGDSCPAELTCNLFLDNISTTNPFSDLFIVGNYTFIYNTTGNINYTMGNITKTLVVTLAPSVCKKILPDNLKMAQVITKCIQQDNPQNE